MRIQKLHVRNLRSIGDTGEFQLERLFALVGENNTGKSNVLRAIEVLLTAGTGRMDRDDFFDDSQSIVVKATFSDLTAKERVQWRPYLVGETLTLEKHISIGVDDRTGKDKAEAEYHGYKAEPKDWYLSLKKIQEKCGDRPKWIDIVKECGLPDYFSEEGKTTKATFAKGLSRYLLENDVSYDEPDLSGTQALGLQSNVIAGLPRVYLLPAITNYEDEIDRRSSSSTFRRLMGALSERLLHLDPRFEELQTAVTTLRNLLNGSKEGGAQRIQTMTTVEGRVTQLLRQMMPSVAAVTLSVEVDEIKDLFSAGVAMSVNDGVDTDVLAKGHGLQRCIVFTLLQTLILNERNQLLDGGLDAINDPILLLVEEPELYIHPQLAKLFFDVLVSFSATDQVIYTTHSSVFVDAFTPERVAIVSKADPAKGTRITGCNQKAFDGLHDKKLFQGFTRLTPVMNEVFFARRVLLVEGPDDLIMVNACLRVLGRISSRTEELGWSVIACGGKQAIPFFQRVLNAFEIPYAVLHDSDLPEGAAGDKAAVEKKRNEEIGALAINAKVHTFPIKLETSLGLDHHFNDQFEAHLFFQTPEKITKEVMDVVASIFA